MSDKGVKGGGGQEAPLVKDCGEREREREREREMHTAMHPPGEGPQEQVCEGEAARRESDSSHGTQSAGVGDEEVCCILSDIYHT
jgi:hypothetical protein